MNGRVGRVSQSAALVVMLIISTLSAFVIIGGNTEGDSGGPDAFGYRWTDSNLPSPTVNYNWVEISGSGTNIGFHSDDGEYGSFPIGFTFTYYGSSKSSFYIANNGAILFNSGSVNAGNSQIPSTSSAEDVICPFWDDLYTAGNIYYQTMGSAPNRYLVVEWRNINHIGYQSGYATFEVILYESSNRIKFQYQDVVFGSASYDYGNSATLGIENIDGSIGLQYSYNTAGLSSNLAIEFSRYIIDYIMIADAPGPGGTWVGDTTYSVGNTVTFYAQGFNNSLGYVEDVNADWTCSNTMVGTVTTPGYSTTFDAVGGGTCFVQATYASSLTNSTGTFTIGVPPQIENVFNVPSNPNGTTAVTVYANLTDPDGIGSATLYYSFDGVTFTPVPMGLVGGDTYSGTIPAPGVTTTVYYYIDTADSNGFLNSSSLLDYVADSDIPQIGAPYIEPKCPNATVDVNVTFDIIEDTGIMNSTLFYSYDGVTWFNTTMSYLGAKGLFYEYDVETGPSGWTHYAISGPAGDNWVISSARSYTPVNSWYSGPEPSANWGDSCLESPLFLNLPTFSNLSFWHWYDFYSFPVDGGIVEINDGSGWVQITPVDGYDGTLTTGWQNPIEGCDAFTTSSGGWQQETFDLSAYTGADVRIRFHVGWNNINDGPREGWYIDNITLFSDFGGCAGVIPGPGYSTWVYYYAQVTDDAGNSNTSNVFSYFADGDPPEVIDISSIASPKATNAQIPVIVNITDNYGLNLNNVNLWYDDGSGWTSIPMAYVSGNYTNATFQGYIPPTIMETTVFYYVQVADNASNYNVSATNSYLTNTPPSITGIIHIPQFPNGSMSVNVSCNITDIDGIGSATLYYSGDGVTFTPTPMNLVGGDTYGGTIPGLGTPYVYYYIEASDTNGFSDISTTISFFVDVEPPYIGVPNITPPNPNASVDVNVSFIVRDNVGVDDVTLWYTYDMLTWFSTAVYNTSASITGRNPPSGFTTGDLSATYTNNNQFITSLYVYAYSGDNDTLYVNIEGYNPSTSSWESIYDGTGGSGVKVDITYSTPTYTQWRILCDDTENNDNIDYNFVYSVVSRYGMIPGPGYSTWVYYYITARDQANNTNVSTIYSYYLDGNPPVVIDLTNITGLVATNAQTMIYANITDDYAIDVGNVYLWYDNGNGWVQVPMSFVGGNSTNATFSAYIPPTNAQTTVFYYVDCMDTTSNAAVSSVLNYLTNFAPQFNNVIHDPLYPNGTIPVTVYANITDSDGVLWAELYYSTDGISYTAVPMNPVGGDTYSATIPPLAVSTFYYYVNASDNLGVINSSNVFTGYADVTPPELGIPSINPSNPNATVDVNVTVSIRDDIAVANATLWYSYDNVNWVPVNMSLSGGAYVPPSGGTSLGSSSTTVSGSTGLVFGLDNYGEFFSGGTGIRYPSFTDHISAGNELEGYTLAYDIGAGSYVRWAVHSNRFGINPGTIYIIDDTAILFRGYIVTYTSDGNAQIIQEIIYHKDTEYILIYMTVVNLAGSTLQNVVLKRNVDWDIDNGASGDTFNWDSTRNMGYAYDSRFGGLGSPVPPDYYDLDGWDDEDRRLTDGDVTSGPTSFDGLVTLHWELGDIDPGDSKTIPFYYTLGNTLSEIESGADNAISATVMNEGSSGIIPGPGHSTWVYYYIVAFDQGFNSNSTPIYSYFVDGNAPVIVDITDVISPVSTSAQQTIFANITDDYGLSFSDVYLWYNMGAGWFSVPMNFVAGNATDATFRTNIPASGSETTVFYYVEAGDNSLNHNVSVTKSYMTNSPPSFIDVNHQPQYPNGSSTVTVLTNITDIDGIGSVTLYYSTDGVTFTATPMVFVSGNMYSGSIPPLGASTVYYYVEAVDTNGFDSTSGILSFLVDIEPPYFGMPTIDPQYPNTVESVDVSAMIGDNTAIDDATLWFTYDNIVWYNTQMGSSTYDLTGRNPAVGFTQGDLSVTYTYFNQYITALYVYAYSSDGDTLYVRIEGYNPSTGLWEIIYSSSGGTGVKVDTTYPSPTYTQWKIFVDDTENNDDIYYDYSYSVTSYDGIIPGPGYPTRINYYLSAVDLAGNTNSSPIYTYTVGSDLTISSRNITFWPDPIQNGTAVLINATVYNQGGLLTGVEARFYDGNPDTDFDNVIDSGAREIGTPFIFDIASNTEALVQTSWTPGLRGLHEVYVWVDAINATWEWDDWNNLARKDLDVYDWLDNMLDETKIETKSNITIKDGQAELVNIGGSLSVVGTSYYSSVGGSGSDYYAQSFIATENSLNGVGIHIAGSSTPYPDMRVALWGDSGGNPDRNNVIAVGDVISGSSMTSTGKRYYLNFSSPQPVVLGWRYWVVIDGYYDHNTSGRCRAKYNSGNVYLDGIFRVSNNIGASWSTPGSNVDLDFYVSYYRPAMDGYLKSTEITLPLGMTWETLFINKSGPDTTYISVTILDGANEAPITGFIDMIAGVINISQIDPEQYPSIKLEGYLGGDGIASPLLLYWAINWVPCPKAHAGPDDTVDEDVPYTFNGSASWSSLGIVKYAWDMDAGDGLDWDPPDYEGPDRWDPIHTYDTPGVYVVTLNVTDINGYWDTDTVVITVNDITPPVVDAGEDNAIDEDAIYNFDAGGSVDNSGTIVSYLWDMDASDGVDPSNPDYTGVSTSHVYSEPGTYTVWLYVSDAAGNWNSTAITITVFDITAPSADAGSDGSIKEDDTYFFDGTGSQDNVAIIFYNWTFGDGYHEYGTDPMPQHTYTSDGIYAVNLRVTDGEGNWDEDSLTIYVNNVPPVADAGENKTENQGDPVTFDGSGCWDTPSDISSLNYIWYFGDGTVGSGKVVNHVYSTVGNYIVTLVVNDNNGASSSDTLSVQVIDGLPPHADCGNDATIYQNSAHTFDGSGSYDNCGIANYAWDMDAGDGFDWANPDYSGPEMVTPKHTYSQPGVYTVTLNVTDTSGFWDTDFVIITVVDSEHPIADAGEDGYVDQSIPYQLDGGGSTDNTGIVMYLWDVDESDGIDWSEPDYIEASPIHIFTEPGPYVVTLKVVDSDGNSDTDSITIIVIETETEENVPCPPTDLEILLVGTGDALELRWTEPTTNMDGSPLTDLLRYEIYFRAREDGEFIKLDDHIDPGDTSFVHSGLTPNTTGYYYLVAVDTSFTRSSPSLMVSGIPNVDTDGDQIPNRLDTDDDNDGWNDTIEEAAGSDPLDDTSAPRDTDRDGTPDIFDADDDNDGHPDYKDDYPLDATRWKKSEAGFDWFWILVILIVILFCIIVLLVLRPWKRDEKEVKKITVDMPPPTSPLVPPTPMAPGVTAKEPSENLEESRDLPPVWAALYYGEERPEKTQEKVPDEPEEASAPSDLSQPPSPPGSQQSYNASAQQTTPEEVPLPPAKGDEVVGRSVEGAEAVEPKHTAVMVPLADHKGQEPQPEKTLAGEEERLTPDKEKGTVEWIIEDKEEEAIPPPAIQEPQPEMPLGSEEETAKPEKDIAPVEWIFEKAEGEPVTPPEPEPITHEEGFEPAPLEPEIPKEETRLSPEEEPEPLQEKPAIEEEQITPHKEIEAQQPTSGSPLEEPSQPPAQEPGAQDEIPTPPERPVAEEPKKGPAPRPPKNWKANKKN